VKVATLVKIVEILGGPPFSHNGTAIVHAVQGVLTPAQVKNLLRQKILQYAQNVVSEDLQLGPPATAVRILYSTAAGNFSVVEEDEESGLAATARRLLEDQ
jgi:hypothetical protein